MQGEPKVSSMEGYYSPLIHWRKLKCLMLIANLFHVR